MAVVKIGVEFQQAPAVKLLCPRELKSKMAEKFNGSRVVNRRVKCQLDGAVVSRVSQRGANESDGDRVSLAAFRGNPQPAKMCDPIIIRRDRDGPDDFARPFGYPKMPIGAAKVKLIDPFKIIRRVKRIDVPGQEALVIQTQYMFSVAGTETPHVETLLPPRLLDNIPLVAWGMNHVCTLPKCAGTWQFIVKDSCVISESRRKKLALPLQFKSDAFDRNPLLFAHLSERKNGRLSLSVLS
jgi:hypothetical protein